MREEQLSSPGIPGQGDLWQLGVSVGWAALPPIPQHPRTQNLQVFIPNIRQQSPGQDNFGLSCGWCVAEEGLSVICSLQKEV